MKKVVFFNHWHNGDIHVSRGIVKQIINKVNQQDPTVEFFYTHRNAPDMLLDIPNLGYDPLSINKLNSQDSVLIHQDIVYINTWYDQQFQKFARQCGILTIDALYAAFDAACQKIWNFSLQEISNNSEDFFPIIDYSKFKIEKALDWLEQHTEEKILIGNGNALSNQAYNFQMAPIVNRLAIENPHKTFILSQRENCDMPANVCYTSDIIQKNGTDLNEISFLSSKCNLIIGKASGAFTFSLTQENLFRRKIKFLCFSHLMTHQSKFWLGKLFSDRTTYSSNVMISAASNINDIYDIIRGQL